MSDTTYIDFVQPAVNAEWLNEVNNHVWHDTPVNGATVHMASTIAVTPFDDIAATDVQAALNEINDKIPPSDPIDASEVSYTPEGTGAVTTTVQSKLREIVSVKDFGAVGDGVTDSSSAVQSALDLQGEVIPVGIYLLNSPVTSDYTDIALLATTPTRRYALRGSSQNNTILKYSGAGYCITANGGTDGAVQGFDKLSDFSLVSVTPYTNSGISITQKNCTKLTDIYLNGFTVGLSLDGVFAAKVDNIKVAGCTTGLQFTGSSTLGPCNAVQINRGNFESCSTLGVNGLNIGTNISFENCDVEGCGTTGNLGTGGINLIVGSSTSQGPVRVVNTYFEANRGGFDFRIDKTVGSAATVVLDGLSFMRLSATDHTSTNISINNTGGGGKLTVILKNTSFISAGDYVPSIAEPYYIIGAGCELIDGGGNVYSSALPIPNNSSARPGVSSEVYVGDVLGTGVANFLPRGVSVTRVEMGIYDVTNSTGWGVDINAYFPVAISASETNNAIVHRVVKLSSTVFRVLTTDTGATAVDCAFYFQVARTV